MGKVEKFEDLEVWKLGCLICRKAENLFQETGLGKNYSLRNQMEKSSRSIMDYNAEGFGREVNRNLLIFLATQKDLLLNLNLNFIERSTKS